MARSLVIVKFDKYQKFHLHNKMERKGKEKDIENNIQCDRKPYDL